MTEVTSAPVRTAEFTVYAAPSRATPQLPSAKCREDFDHASTRSGKRGLVGGTEVMREPERNDWALAFGGQWGEKDGKHQVIPARSYQPTQPCMSPMGWGESMRLVKASIHPGCQKVPEVNNVREFPSGVFQIEGIDWLRIGGIFVHMNPGAYNPGTPEQYAHQAESQVQWGRYKSSILDVKQELLKTCDVVFTVGDINRLDYVFPGDTEVSKDRIIYIGYQTRHEDVKVRVLKQQLYQQNADHQADLVRVQVTVPSTLTLQEQ